MSRLVRTHRWAVVLAGGDGSRLRPLTRTLAGDDRPKQFCSILGDRSLLEATRRRVMLGVSPHRTLVVVTRTHERFYLPALAHMRVGAVVVQPENRGTAPAVLYALLRLASMAPQDMGAAFFPADHHVSDDPNHHDVNEGEWLRGDLELDRLHAVVGEEIERALMSLSEYARTVVLLDLEGLSEHEIASLVDCAVGTVKSRPSRARALLRHLLADYARTT